MFTENSIVVKTWFTAVMSGVYTYAQVPNLLNLREQVGKKLTQIGYDITEPVVTPEPEVDPEPTPELVEN